MQRYAVLFSQFPENSLVFCCGGIASNSPYGSLRVAADVVTLSAEVNNGGRNQL